MKIKKKKVIIAAGIIAVIGIGVFVKAKAGSEKPQGLMVSTTALTQKDIEESITLKAPLEGTESIEVVSRLHYEILQIHVKEGDMVKKGQVLAVLDSKSLKDDIETARDQLELKKYELNEKLKDANENYIIEKQRLDEKLRQSQIEYEQAVKDLEEAKRQLDNTKQLFEAGVAPQEDVKAKETAVTMAQTKVDGFTVADGQVVPDESERKALETASNGVTIVDGKAVASSSDLKSIDISQKELQRKIEDLEDCEIKSTIDGTVTRVYGNVGRFADDISDGDKTQPIFVIENMDRLQMTVSVSEYDIAKIKEGQRVEIGAEILGNDTVEGIVARISPTGEERNSNGTVERVIPTQIDVTGSNSKLIAGITAKAKIEIAESLGAFVVPNETVLENLEGVNQIYRVNSENKIEIIPVELGLQNDLEIEIKSDQLAEGDNIILTPDLSMTEGMDVTVIPSMGM